MSSIHSEHLRLLNYLKEHASPSVIETALHYSLHGHVIECSRSGSQITGAVREPDESTMLVELSAEGGTRIAARCSCSGTHSMEHDWCAHAAALLWQASQLGFLDEQGGFASQEATIKTYARSPQEISEVLNEICRPDRGTALPASHWHPEVKVALDVSSDRLGVQISFDGDLQSPSIMGRPLRVSSRALDNILLHTIEDHGFWDEARQLWYINSSHEIEILLGILQEYKSVHLLGQEKELSFSPDPLQARLEVTWQMDGAELGMHWVLPGGLRCRKQTSIFGTGPYWTAIDSSIYRISSPAAKIASIFPYSENVQISRSSLAPLLEVLGDKEMDLSMLEIRNPALWPQTVVKAPRPILDLTRRLVDSFSAQDFFEIEARLSFEYPSPRNDQNVVYLPDKVRETECLQLLKQHGFTFNSDKKTCSIEGDNALDLLHDAHNIFPSNWKVSGLDSIRGGLRFADLALNIRLFSDKDGERSSGSECHISLVQNNANVPISLLFKNARGGSDRWVKLDSGAWGRVPGGGLKHLKTRLGMVSPDFRMSNAIRTNLSLAQALSLSREQGNGIKVSSDKTLQDLEKRLQSFEKIPAVKPSRGFTGTLRHYQADGLSWMHFLRDFNLSGILADEMGLGKTVQALALLQSLKDSTSPRKKLKRPALVVAPTSILVNWSYEARRFAPKLKVLILSGPQRRNDFVRIPEHDLIITSYALLRMDRYELEKYRFSYVILDEAQNIKNPDAAVTKAAKCLQADQRLVLTGTPTENRPLELWSIMDFLMPGYLGSEDFFRNYIEKPILEDNASQEVVSFLNSRTRPFILRRTKAEVEKDLPPKLESIQYVPMCDSQRELYSQVLAEVRPKVFDAVSKRGVGGASVSILAALLRLRQICNHPNSIDAFKEFEGFESGKFNLLKDLVTEAVEENHKILLFCQFREMLAIIRRWLEEAGISHLYLDGTTKNRQQLVDRFNSDESVKLFLISLKAGGTGLNLASADTVVLYDPWWNPAVEHQAVDRAHRIGQKRKVSVYRLVTEHSIEQKIMDLKSRKSRIVDALINENGLSSLKLSKADLENLFSPLPDSSV